MSVFDIWFRAWFCFAVIYVCDLGRNVWYLDAPIVAVVCCAAGVRFWKTRIPILMGLFYAWNAHRFVFLDSTSVSVSHFVITHKRRPTVDGIQIRTGIAIDRNKPTPLAEILRAFNESDSSIPTNDLFLRTVPFLVQYRKILQIVERIAETDWVVVFEDDARPDRGADRLIRLKLATTDTDVVLLSSVNIAPLLCNVFSRTMFGIQGAAFRTSEIPRIADSIRLDENVLRATSIRFPWSAPSNTTVVEAYPDIVLSRLCFDLQILRCSCLPVVHES